MPLQTVQQVAHERLMECSATALARFRDYVRPIYGATADGRPNHIGSAILLRLREGPFLLTAAHNLDWNKSTSLYVGVDTTESLTVDAFVCVPPGGQRNQDTIDFALARLPDRLASKIDPTVLLPESQMSRSVADPDGRFYTCLGYPNSKNRTPPRFQRLLTPKLGIYTSNGVSFDRLGGRTHADLHILVDFNFKYSRDEGGVRVNSIKPNGFSGGAVIDLGRLSDPASLGEPCNPKMIALFIEAHREQKVILATRIMPILDAYRKHGLPS
jgi:hypothetical protein